VALWRSILSDPVVVTRSVVPLCAEVAQETVPDRHLSFVLSPVQSSRQRVGILWLLSTDASLQANIPSPRPFDFVFRKEFVVSSVHNDTTSQMSSKWITFSASLYEWRHIYPVHLYDS